MIEYMNVGDYESIIKLPCRLKDHIYHVEFTTDKYESVEYIIIGVEIDYWSITISLSPVTDIGWHFKSNVSHIGEELFHTREEAETKAAELNERLASI